MKYYPLTTTQQVVWLDQIISPLLPKYNIGATIFIRGNIDIPRLNLAIQTLLSESDSLHFVFSHSTSGPAFNLKVINNYALDEVDFSLDDEPKEKAGAYMKQQFQQPFSIYEGRMWKMAWIKLSETEGYWFLCFHHLIMDGMSLTLLGTRIAKIYNELERGVQISQPIYISNYINYINKDQKYLTSLRFEKDKIFWAKKIKTLPEPLFTQRTTSQVGEPFGQVILPMKRDLYEKITALSRQLNCSNTHFFLSAFAIYFSRVNQNREALIVGMPVHNRLSAVEKLTIGMFSSILPVRVYTGSALTFKEVITQVSEELKSNYRHQRFPVSEMVKSLEPRRQLFDISISIEDFDTDLDFDNLHSKISPLHNGFESQPLSIYVRSFGVDTEALIEFNFDLNYFSSSNFEKHILGINHLIESIIEQPQNVIATLPIVNNEQYHYLVHNCNETDMPFLLEQPFHKAFERRVGNAPNKIALLSKTQNFTYEQLNKHANRLAHYLINLGVSKETRVAVIMEKSVYLMVAVLAVLKAGGAFVPISPSLPKERKNFIINDCTPFAAIVENNVSLDFEQSGITNLVEMAQYSNLPDTNPHFTNNAVGSPNLAYIIYTSGSTGTPKGVMLEHKGLTNFAFSWCRKLEVNASSIVLQFSQFSFDGFIAEFAPPLVAGASIYIPLQKEPLAGYELNKVIENNNITHAFLPPAVMMKMPEDAELSSLKCLLTAGDSSSKALVSKWGDKLTLFNAYGPTETTVAVLLYKCRYEEKGVPPIGQPIDNTQVYILDNNSQLVPEGVVGEICIAGAGLARGYLNKPELTQLSFINNPFSTATEDKLYKTGDLGIRRNDGAIEFIGRNDHQIKIRGFRIELGEIETQINKHHSVRESIVVCRTDAHGFKRLFAYVVGESIKPEQIKTHLSQWLPDYMLPTAYVVISNFPLNLNGKIDKSALPEPEDSDFLKNIYAAPVGHLETLIAENWADLLSLKKVGRTDHFFDLGGHSLLAVQVISHLRKHLNLHLELNLLFSHPELKAFAKQVAKAKQGDGLAIEVGKHNDPCALSYAQQRLWFIDKMDKRASVAYHMPGSFRLRGTLNIAALQQALDALVERHEVLRTRFELVDETPRQVVDEDASFSLKMIKGAHLSSESLVNNEINKEVLTPFSLAQGPLIRGLLIQCNEQEHILTINMHHIVSDGWSVGILMQELSQLYNAYHNGTTSPLLSLNIHYRDFSRWQQQLQQNSLNIQLDYWCQQLSGAPELVTLPTEKHRPEVQDYQGGWVPVSLSAELTKQLQQLSRHHGVTLYMTVLSAWAAVVSRLSSTDDVVIGSPNANRNRAELESLIGLLVNTQAMRISFANQPTVAQLLAQVKNTALAAQQHQDIPFDHVVEALKPNRSTAYSPIFQLLFAWQNTPKSSLVLDELTTELVENHCHSAKFDLSLDLYEKEGQIMGSLIYASAIFDEVTVKRYWGYLEAMLSGMVENSHQGVDKIPLLSQLEQTLLLEKFNTSLLDMPDDMMVHELIAHQAQVRPASIAVVFEEQELTYAQLESQATTLANKLQQEGIISGSCVGVCLHRSCELIIAIVAIYKAGGVYVPLDPDYPEERLSYLISDSQPLLILSHTSIAQILPQEVAVIRVDQLDWQSSVANNNGLTQVTELQTLQTKLTEQDVAYIIYTSGSTGKPKGVLVPHQGLRNLVAWLQQKYQLVPGEAVLKRSSISFDMSVLELFWPLCYGGKLVIAKPEGHKNPVYLHELVQRHEITTASFVPALLKAFLQFGSSNVPLKRMFCGGDKLTTGLVNEVISKWPDAVLHNLYGPTEASVLVSEWQCQLSDGITPIGKPIANTQIYILDRNQQPVPIGVLGEIYIGGAGLAQGYLNQPELTEACFVADPFSARLGARLYRTGDLGRWRQDGVIMYAGRNDYQVKIRGFRIELGEIEKQLLACEGVKDTAVIADEDHQGFERLVAYLVCDKDVSIIRDELSLVLPDYMVPSAYVTLSDLPLLSNGKLDRRALPTPDADAFIQDVYQAPIGSVEKALAEIWTNLLAVPDIGRNDNFFALGGHSLLAINLIEQLKQRDWTLDIKTLFKQPVLHQLAKTIVINSENHPVVPANGIPENCLEITPEMVTLAELDETELSIIAGQVLGGMSNIQDIYPLAPLQEGILFHHLLQTEGDAYLTQSLLSFDNEDRLKRFIKAINVVIARHDILRTAVLWEGLSEPMQVVWRAAAFETEYTTCTSAAELRACANPRCYRLDVRYAPMFKSFVGYDTTKKCWMLLLLNHHLIMDHTSLEIMMDEVSQIMSGDENKLFPPVPFRHFVGQVQLGKTQDEHKHFFTEMLADVTEPTAPFELQNSLSDGGDIEEAELILELAFSEQIRWVSRKYGVSAASLFHLAWAQVLAKTSGREDVVFGTVLFGRLQGVVGADRTMGMFINTLPLRLQLQDKTVEESLIETSKNLASLLEHENASLALAQQCSALGSSTPLLISLFNFRHSPQLMNAESFFEGISVLEANERTNYSFNMSVDDTTAHFKLTAQVDNQLCAERICRYMVLALKGIITNLADKTGEAMSSVGILPKAELAKVIHQFNDNAASVPNHCLIQDMFYAVVAKMPNNTAIEFMGQALSYQQLDEQTDKLAAYLLSQVGAQGARVGISLDRGIDMIVSYLATLKAGCSFVPIDPNYPEERILYMLEDSAPDIIITSQAFKHIMPNRHLLFIEQWAEEPHSACNEKTPVDLLKPSQTATDLLAYTMYTSGSTGRPKGVMITHTNVVNLVLAMQETFDIDDSSRLLQFSSMSFDAFISELFPILCAGGTLCIPDPSEPCLGLDLDKFVFEHQISHAILTPSVLAYMPLEATLNPIKVLVVAGEVCGKNVVARWGKQRKLINCYGPTETTVGTTTHVCDVADDYAPPIGRPFMNTQVYILDDSLQPVPIGVTGEIYIGGMGVGLGYLNQKELTYNHFIANNLHKQTKGLMYKSGDLGRWREDGAIEFIGRRDNQVKIRGMRVELSEIEAQLQSVECISSAIVNLWNNENNEKRLIAYIVLNGKADVIDDKARAANSELISHQLKLALPNHMVPSTYIYLDKIPLTVSGKLDKKSLPALDFSECSQEYEEPKGEIEETLAEIWQRILSLEKVGVTTSFFDLGGHSILMINLIVQIENELGIRLNVQTLFEMPTIRALAEHISNSTTPQESDTTLVTLMQKSENLPKLFCIPGAGGIALAFMDLSSQICEAFTLVSINHKGVLEEEAPDETLEQTADYYAQKIIEEQPEGEYTLLGHSSGGQIAYEIAVRLSAMQKQVKLVLLDTFLISDFDLIHKTFAIEQDEDYLAKGNPLVNFISDRHEDSEGLHAIYADMDEGLTTRLDKVWRHMAVLAKAYRPKIKFKGKLLMVYTADPTTDEYEAFNDKTLAEWVEGHISYSVAAGDHLTMLSGQGAVDIANSIIDWSNKQL